MKKKTKVINITKKIYIVTYTIPNLNNAKKVLTEVPELIVRGR